MWMAGLTGMGTSSACRSLNLRLSTPREGLNNAIMQGDHQLASWLYLFNVDIEGPIAE